MMGSRSQIVCLLENQSQCDWPLWAALRRRGNWDPVVRTLSNGRATDAQRTGAPLRLREDRTIDLSRLKALWEELEQDAPRSAAVVVPDSPSAETRLALAWCQARRLPIILLSDRTLNEPVAAGVGGWIHWGLDALRARLFNAFFTTGALGIQELRAIGVPRERIATGLYSIDIERWRSHRESGAGLARAFRAELGGGRVFLARHVGNHELLVQAFQTVSLQDPGARLVLMGGGPRQAEIRRTLLESRRLADKVRVVQGDSLEHPAMYHGAADVFIYAPERDRWGVCIAEAMACGLPVAATTTVAAAADLVIPGRTGALAMPESATSLAQAMLAASNLVGKDAALRSIAQEVARVGVDRAVLNFEELIGGLSSFDSWPAWRASLRDEVYNSYGRWSL